MRSGMTIPTTRTTLLIVAFVAVCGLAIAGWMRKNDRPADSSFLTPQPLSSQPYSNANSSIPQPSVSYAQQQYPNSPYPNAQYPNGQAPYPASSYEPSQPGYDAQSYSSQVYTSGDGYYPSRMRPVYVRQHEVITEQAAPEPQYRERRVAPRVEYYTDSRGYRHRGRSKTHSVEIVAGTAAVGAAIGGIAGGGKGAALGALSGGGAGFIYDRLTHNK